MKVLGHNVAKAMEDTSVRNVDQKPNKHIRQVEGRSPCEQGCGRKLADGKKSDQ